MAIEQQYKEQAMLACVMLTPHCFGEGKFSAEQIYDLTRCHIFQSTNEVERSNNEMALGELLDVAKGNQNIVDYIYNMLLFRDSDVQKLHPIIQALSETQVLARLVGEGKLSRKRMNESLSCDDALDQIQILNQYGERFLSFAQGDQKIIGWMWSNLLNSTSAFKEHWVESVERFVSYIDLLSYLRGDGTIDIYKLLDRCVTTKCDDDGHALYTHTIDTDEFKEKIKNQIHITECDDPFIQDLVSKYDVSYFKNLPGYSKWTEEEKQATFYIELRPYARTQNVIVELCDQNGNVADDKSIPSPEGVAILQKVIDDKFTALMAGFEEYKATVVLEQAAISEDVGVMDPDAHEVECGGEGAEDAL